MPVQQLLISNCCPMETTIRDDRYLLATQLGGLACLMNRVVTLVRKRHDLSVLEFHSLLAVRTHHPSCIQALGSRLESEKTRTSKVLRSLESRRLIRRSSDLRDRRIEHVELTDQGERLTNRILADLDSIGHALLLNLPEQDMLPFRRFLDRLGDVCVTDILSSSPGTPSKERDDDE
jgi:DNA-binding MarR family transcriptional regulator